MTDETPKPDPFAELGRGVRAFMDAYEKAGRSFLAAVGMGQSDFTLSPSAIAEPTEFGSAVRAPWNGRERVWVRVQNGYWEDETGITVTWSELDSPEVLRIGVGEAPPFTEEEIDQQQAEANRILHKLNTAAVGEIGRPDPDESRFWEAQPSDFDRANMADESARLDEANALEDARPVHHDHVSLAVVLRVLDGIRDASITATEQEVVRRCHTAVMKLPTYVGCWP